MASVETANVEMFHHEKGDEKKIGETDLVDTRSLRPAVSNV